MALILVHIYFMTGTLYLVCVLIKLLNFDGHMRHLSNVFPPFSFKNQICVNFFKVILKNLNCFDANAWIKT